mmetsp:Transcript_82594/g.230304  ORF Transcript_82594/g.230304 Transcript_82594/m.230304 type:complete len:140 (+) Transcript_82594:888-1307(+)
MSIVQFWKKLDAEQALYKLTMKWGTGVGLTSVILRGLHALILSAAARSVSAVLCCCKCAWDSSKPDCRKTEDCSNGIGITSVVEPTLVPTGAPTVAPTAAPTVAPIGKDSLINGAARPWACALLVVATLLGTQTMALLE